MFIIYIHALPSILGTFPLFPRQITNPNPNPDPNPKPNNGFCLIGLTDLLGFIMVD